METITRMSKATGEKSILFFDDAVDQFIRDNHKYGEVEEDVETYIDDMVTVFETREMLNMMDEEGVDVGEFIYRKS